VRFHYRNMLSSGFPDDYFDAVVNNETTMYVDLDVMFSEVGRLLKPHGQYVAFTWCANDADGEASPDVAYINRHHL